VSFFILTRAFQDTCQEITSVLAVPGPCGLLTFAPQSIAKFDDTELASDEKVMVWEKMKYDKTTQISTNSIK
jgi:hypothetical protein